MSCKTVANLRENGSAIDQGAEFGPRITLRYADGTQKRSSLQDDGTNTNSGNNSPFCHLAGLNLLPRQIYIKLLYFSLMNVSHGRRNIRLFGRTENRHLLILR